MTAALRERFDSALEELNYGRRCGLLSSIGRDVRAANLGAAATASFIDSLAADPAVATTSSFVALARLIVAKMAGCTGYGGRFLAHNSQSVIYEVVNGKGLLTEKDARDAFLSSESRRKLKVFLARSHMLVPDQEVLDHAQALFGEKDCELVWEITSRVEDAEMFAAQVKRIRPWFDSQDVKDLPYLAKVARRFPRFLLDVMSVSPKWVSWYWLKEVLAVDPKLVLEKMLCEAYFRGSGPRRQCDPRLARQGLRPTLVRWAWRHQPELMLETCEKNKNLAVGYAREMVEITSTKKYLSTNRKITLLGEVWRRVQQRPIEFVKLLPVGDPARPEEMDRITNSVLAILDSMPTQRRELLVGPEGCQSCTTFLQVFASRLSVGKAVDQFLAVLEEFEAGRGAYSFFIKTVCTSSHKMKEGLTNILVPAGGGGGKGKGGKGKRKLCVMDMADLREKQASRDEKKAPDEFVGKHDPLMLRVFQRYLNKEGQSASDIVSMFLDFLGVCATQDVIHVAFGSLLAHLGQKMEPGLLAKVVCRMGELDGAANDDSITEGKTPQGTLPLPVGWARLIDMHRFRDWGSSDRVLSKESSPVAPPHVTFLMDVLRSEGESKGQLGLQLERHGRRFFWDTLGHVLSARLLSSSHQQSVIDVCASPSSFFDHVDVLREADEDPGNSASLERKMRRTAPTEETFEDFFVAIGESKKKVNAKEQGVRSRGYMEVIQLASKADNPKGAFTKLLPYLLKRFNAEPDAWGGCRDAIMDHLFGGSAKLPTHYWTSFTDCLRDLWRLASKAREQKFEGIWTTIGTLFVFESLLDCRADGEPDGRCEFGMEVLETVVPDWSDRASILTSALRGAQEGASGIRGEKGRAGEDRKLEGGALASAARWVLTTAVPLTSDSGLPLEMFWQVLREMSSGEEHGGERALWDRWSFVSDRWKALLRLGATHKSADFVMHSVVHLLCLRQRFFMTEQEFNAFEADGANFSPWLAPLECTEYKDTVQSLLCQVKSGEIPTREGSQLVLMRVEALVRCAWVGGPARAAKHIVFPRSRASRVEFRVQALRSDPGSFPLVNWIQDQLWDVSRHGKNTPVPWLLHQCSDEVVKEEVAVLAALLGTADNKRALLWNLIEVGAYIAGPLVSGVFEAALRCLKPNFEGMARGIGRHYRFLNSALTRGDDPEKTSDVLTPLLELWLLDDKTRDERVGKLMQQPDHALFLFFGHSFARHLVLRRQEWLHLCLDKLVPFTGEKPEFYHFAKRGPELIHLPILGTASWRDQQEQQVSDDATVFDQVQMYLWHPKTQESFLTKACTTTEPCSLSLMARAAFADSFAHVGRVLERYPSDPTGKDGFSVYTDTWGWQVLQQAGNYRDIEAEVERRFRELPPPPLPQAVGDPQVEVLLAALGKADDAVKSLHVLGRYAGKVKEAKAAVTKMMDKVDSSRARDVIRDVMLPCQAGVGMQTAGLKKIVELGIKDPLELYTKVWRAGHAQRDLAGLILAQVATAVEVSGADEDRARQLLTARGFFGVFDSDRDEDDKEYIADFLLAQLTSTPTWQPAFSFLAGVVAKLAFLPGATKSAVQALRANRSHPTEVLQALAEIYNSAREVAGHKTAGSPVLEGLQEVLDGWMGTLTSITADSGMALEDATSESLAAIVDTSLDQWCQDLTNPGPSEAEKRAQARREALTSLERILGVWSRLIRKGGGKQRWLGLMFAMDEKLQCACRHASQTELVACQTKLAASLVERVEAGEFCAADHNELVSAVSEFFAVLVDDRFKAPDARDCGAAGQTFKDSAAARRNAAWTVIKEQWPKLLALGCQSEHVEALLERCAHDRRKDLVQSIVSCAGGRLEQMRPRAEARRHLPVGCNGLPASGVPTTGILVTGTVTFATESAVFAQFGFDREGRLLPGRTPSRKFLAGDLVEAMTAAGGAGGELELRPPAELGSAEGEAKYVRASPIGFARRAVEWLCSQPGAEEVWDQISTLWADMVLLRDESSASGFGEDMRLLGQAARSPELLLEPLRQLFGRAAALAATHGRASLRSSFARLALDHVAGPLGRPAAAVGMWPALLRVGTGAEDLALLRSDLAALLAVCEQAGVRFPVFADGQVKEWGMASAQMLRKSPLPGARLCAIQVAEACLNKADKQELLFGLCGDANAVVMTSAKVAWNAVRKHFEGAEEMEGVDSKLDYKFGTLGGDGGDFDVDDDNGSDDGKGKGKGKGPRRGKDMSTSSDSDMKDMSTSSDSDMDDDGCGQGKGKDKGPRTRKNMPMSSDSDMDDDSCGQGKGKGKGKSMSGSGGKGGGLLGRFGKGVLGKERLDSDMDDDGCGMDDGCGKGKGKAKRPRKGKNMPMSSDSDMDDDSCGRGKGKGKGKSTPGKV